MKKFFLLLLLNFLSTSLLAQNQISFSFNLDVTEFEKLAIQEGGRVKPFDTYAREHVQLITGKQKFRGKNPTEIVLAWLFFPDQWMEQEFIQIKHLQLKKDLGFSETQNEISPQSIARNSKLTPLLTKLSQLQRDKKKLDTYFTALNRLNNQIMAYQEIISGQGFKLIPQSISPAWLSVSELKGEGEEIFKNVANSYFGSVTKQDPSIFSKAVVDFKTFARAQAPQVYPSENQLSIETTYNNTRPFRLSYIFYLLATVFFALSLYNPHRKTYRTSALILSFIGLTIHTLGFLFRCYIAGRPPVSNMYESVVWVALGTIVFGLFFELKYKKTFIGFAATVMGTLALIIGDVAPAVLDQSIRPLEPVLRSNYWLTIHVLTITLSYAAFTLASGLGNYGLYFYAKGKEKEHDEKLKNIALMIYKSMQIGVLLLTAGTILGGVWADESWGRFWGWDPKETWALIADLGYLAVLHGRFSGMLKTFGTIASAVLCYAGIIMAWYGVNFVLGVGLHSYGFGGGGVSYVSAVLALQLMYVGWASLQHKKHLKTV